MSIAERVIPRISELWQPLEGVARTLVHNDCTPRNICLRLPKPSPSPSPSSSSSPTSLVINSDAVPFEDPRTLCLYDWELCRVDVPHHDVAEFLAFVLSPEVTMTKRMEFIEFYRVHLEYYTGRTYPTEKYVNRWYWNTKRVMWCV